MFLAADLNLESRILDLENAIRSGSGGPGEGLDPATLAEMKQMQGEVAASLAEVKAAICTPMPWLTSLTQALQAVVDSTIQQFKSQNELASNAVCWDAYCCECFHRASVSCVEYRGPLWGNSQTHKFGERPQKHRQGDSIFVSMMAVGQTEHRETFCRCCASLSVCCRPLRSTMGVSPTSTPS